MGNKTTSRVVILGKVTENPVLTTIQMDKDGKKIDVKMASFKINDNGKETEIKAYGKSAECVMQYLTIGMLCCVQGILTQEKTESGIKREITASNVTFLTKRNESQEESESPKEQEEGNHE